MVPAQTTTASDEDAHTTQHFDTMIVFGQGPVKLLILADEATPEQKDRWLKYKKDQKHTREPNFFIMDDEQYNAQLNAINTNKKLSQSAKRIRRNHLRFEWQKTGHFALKRQGRQNALAAGLALYSGLTDELILSGGRTIAQWAKESVTNECFAEWPSEAELMRDIIKENFEKLYREKYNQSIDEVIKIEDCSTNTLENFAYTINRNPDLLRTEYKVGMLSAEHHLKRIGVLAEIFSVTGAKGGQLSAQQVLKQAKIKQESYQKIEQFINDTENESDKLAQSMLEERWLRGLKEPEYVTYWLGYVAEVKYPNVIARVMHTFKDPTWRVAVRETFQFLGLNLDEFANIDLAYLSKNEPEKYLQFVECLKKCKSPQYRKMPPAMV